ncbi:MAG: glycosyltransferase family 9 protein [Acidobacteriota bacterium]
MSCRPTGRRRGAREVLQLLVSLRAERFDEAIDFQGLLKSATLARFSGARRIRGFSRSEAREPTAALFYTDRISTTRDERHQLLHHVDLLDPPACQEPISARFPLSLPQGLEEKLAGYLRSLASCLMVAGDTGPVHLAVAMGTPTVAILGPALAWRTGPFDPQDEVVVHSKACPHPYRRKCRDHFCMDIPVEAVFEAVKSRLAHSDHNDS